MPPRYAKTPRAEPPIALLETRLIGTGEAPAKLWAGNTFSPHFISLSRRLGENCPIHSTEWHTLHDLYLRGVIARAGMLSKHFRRLRHQDLAPWAAGLLCWSDILSKGESCGVVAPKVSLVLENHS